MKICYSSIIKDGNLLILFVSHVEISQTMVPSPPPPTSFFGIVKKISK